MSTREPAGPSPTEQERSAGPGRLGVGAVAVAVMAWSGYRLLTKGVLTSPLSLSTWLIGAVLLHDVLIGPLACLVGSVVARLLPHPTRAVVQTGLATSGVLLLLAYPVLKAPENPNPTVLPRDYPMGLAAALLTVVLLTLVAATVAELRRRRARQPTP